MNWRPILATIAFGGFFIFVAGIIWTGPLHKSGHYRNRTVANVTPSKATILIQFYPPDPIHIHTIEDTSFRSSERDLETYAAILRSYKFASRTLSSLSPAEVTLLLGARFTSSAETPFKGIRIKTIRGDGEAFLSIGASHLDPAAAQAVTTHLYAELIKYLRDEHAEADESAVRFLQRVKRESIEKIRKSKATLAEAQRSENAEAISIAGNDVRIQVENLQRIEDRIAQAEVALNMQIRLPFRVIEARVASGPFWNRAVTDFTADIVKLEKPQADQ